MRRRKCAIVLMILGCLVFSLLGGCDGNAVVEDDPVPIKETLLQVSTLDAILAAVYDGVMMVGTLREQGDFGIGTFNRLDGEMVMLGGKVFQIKDDGVAYPVPDEVTTPFATVTYFDVDRTKKLPEGISLSLFTQLMDEEIPTDNIFYAIKVEGTFSYMKTRSVPVQEKPYPPLVEVTEKQSVFVMENVKGTVVGFYCPPYVAGINMPGYHLHFITRDEKAGGHILDFKVAKATVEIDDTPAFLMLLPGEGSAFYQADLSKDRQEELEQAEK